MTSDIHGQLQAVFQEVFTDDLELRDDLTADNVEGWDSLRHITLIYAIEDEFGIEFAQEEMVDMANVGELKRRIAAKLHERQ